MRRPPRASGTIAAWRAPRTRRPVRSGRCWAAIPRRPVRSRTAAGSPARCRHGCRPPRWPVRRSRSARWPPPSWRPGARAGRCRRYGWTTARWPPRSPANAICGSTAAPRSPSHRCPASGAPADGWVRTHANYPHHRARLLGALGLPEGRRARALARRRHRRVGRRGGPGTGVRGGRPRRRRTRGARPRRGRRPWWSPSRTASCAARTFPPLPDGDLRPAHGIRVLDLTRVIAGPVATRTLALLGADVLRIDSPRLPESADAHADTGFGKRSARLDLADPADRAVFAQLLDSADVVVSGYRPGALDRHGLSARELLARRPGLVVARLVGLGLAAGPGRTGAASTAWSRRLAASPRPRAPRTAVPAPCPPRRWTTARGISWRRAYCGPSPSSRSRAVAAPWA